MKDTLDIKSVYECNRYLGCKTLHPQASIINLEHPILEQNTVKFHFYTVLLIEGCVTGNHCCGRNHYDYSNATMIFLKPGDIFCMDETDVLPTKGQLLAFHPDLLYHTSLKKNIKKYTFFSYYKEEALHLSQRETVTVTRCMKNIEEELHHAIDTHSATILSRSIELMLDYCSRFYERQFITRENTNKTTLKNLEILLHDYILSGQPCNTDVPIVKYCAKELKLSVSYLIDLLKFETGRTLNEYFQLKRLEIAKKMLLESNNTPTFVAQQLGYANVQYFNMLFRKVTGITPREYQYSHL